MAIHSKKGIPVKRILAPFFLLFVCTACSPGNPEDAVRKLVSAAANRSFASLADRLTGAPLRNLYLLQGRTAALDQFCRAIVPAPDLAPVFLRALYRRDGKAVDLLFLYRTAKGTAWGAVRRFGLELLDRGWCVASIQ
jgi:hypothetical protein